MLLIAEIILTFFAWRNWRWLSLIPVGSAIFLGFVVGSANRYADPMDYVWVDILAVVALIVMVSVKPKPQVLPT
jgi:hypothetical protein